MDIIDFVLGELGRLAELNLKLIDEILKAFNETIENNGQSKQFQELLEYAKLRVDEKGDPDYPAILKYATKDFNADDLKSNPTLKKINFACQMTNGTTIAFIKDCDKKIFIDGMLEVANEKLKITRVSPREIAKSAAREKQDIITVSGVNSVQLDVLNKISKRENLGFKYTAIEDSANPGQYSVYALAKDAFILEHAMLEIHLRDESLHGYVLGETNLQSQNDELSRARENIEKGKKVLVVSGSNLNNIIETSFVPGEYEGQEMTYRQFTHFIDKNQTQDGTSKSITFSEQDFAQFSNPIDASNRYTEELELALLSIDKPITITEQEIKENNLRDEFGNIKSSDFREFATNKYQELYAFELTNKNEKALADAQDAAIDAYVANIAATSQNKSSALYENNLVEDFKNGNFQAFVTGSNTELSDEIKKFLSDCRETLNSSVYTKSSLENSIISEYADISDTIDRFDSNDNRNGGPSPSRSR